MEPMDPTLSPAPPRAAREGREAFLADVLEGLTASRKRLPAKYFYDAQGSALFEAITRQPEYYPTRTETAILSRHGAEIAAALPPHAALVELGSGSSAKVRHLLPHLPDLKAYVPVDVSAAFIEAEAAGLRRDFPALRVEPVVGDFTRRLALPPDVAQGPIAGFFPGSTLGNFEPGDAAALLRRLATGFGRDATLVVGIDLVKDAAVLDAAYNDAAEVTAAFNLNVLAHINRELGADFDLGAFAHLAFYDPERARIEMHLVSRRAQSVRIGGVTIAFASGETIHTENSHKYTVPRFRALAQEGGWSLVRTWTDPDGLFAVHALRTTSLKRH
jgi:dimethylhistidine N-methyltransferase